MKDNEEVDGEKIRFINLIEPLTKIVQRQKEYGAKLTALAVMSIVNMCNQYEDIKSIFRTNNGVPIIRELLETTDDDIMLNNLRLLMTLVNPKGEDAMQVSKDIGGQDDCALLLRLIRIVKEGPNITYCSFNNQVKLMLFSLLRVFCQHFSKTKDLIMSDKPKKDSPYDKPVYEVMTQMLAPHRLNEIDKDIEAAILSLLTQIIKENGDYKRLIGKCFLGPVFHARLLAVREYRSLKGKIAMGLQKNPDV